MSDKELPTTVWLVTSQGAKQPAGVFLTQQAAREFIERHSVTGMLSEFPLGESTYDHAVRSGLFSPKNDKERANWFIAEFYPRLPHFHFADGQDDVGQNYPPPNK